MRLEESCEDWLSKSRPSRDLGQQDHSLQLRTNPVETASGPISWLCRMLQSLKQTEIWDNHSNHLLQGSLYEQYPHQAAFLPPGLNSHSGTFWFVCFSACCSTSGMSHCLFSWIKTMAHDQFEPDFLSRKTDSPIWLVILLPWSFYMAGCRDVRSSLCEVSLFFFFLKFNLIVLIFNEVTLPLLSHSFSCLQSLPCFIFPTAPPISHSLLSQRLSGMFHKQGWGYISMSLTVDWNYVTYSCWLL